MALMKGLPTSQRWCDEELTYSPRRGRHAVKGALASTIELVLTLCLGPTLAAAGEPLQPNRPGQADPPTVLAPGVAQIEGGLTFARETEGNPDIDTLTVPELELRLGVHERFELQLFAEGFVQEWRDGDGNHTGVSDLELDTRVRLWEQEGWRPATAVEFGLSFPTGSGFATSDGFDPEGEILYAWDFAERWNLTGNFDFASETQGEDDSSRHFVFRPEFALGLSISERLGTFVAYYGVIEEDAANQHSIDGGFTFLMNDNLQLDVSAGAGLNDAAPDFFVAAGVAWRLPRLRARTDAAQ